MPSGMYKKGGHRRQHKKVGRTPIEKTYKAALRSLAQQGKSHDSGGNPIPNCSPTGTEAGKHMYYGYKAGRSSAR
jgi:hypothetical protein